MNIASNISIIEHFCLREDLSTYDPYDIWKTRIGVKIKMLYFKNKLLGLLPAGCFSVADFYLLNKSRIFFKSQEYPIVRAQAGIVLLNLYQVNFDKNYLDFAKIHIDWLLQNHSKNYSGLCWGTGFKIVIDATTVYNENTPFTTNTPYVLELLDSYYKITHDEKILNAILSIYDFYEKDIVVLEDSENFMITSYGPFKDRVVTNAVSYTMFAYSIFYQYVDNKKYIETKIKKLYKFIQSVQQVDGSWVYAPYDTNSFIDCFHSCFIIKNIIKTSNSIDLQESQDVVNKGYNLIKESFYDSKSGLFKRFIAQNKPTMVKYDLYDNSEVLNLAILMKDVEIINKLEQTIRLKFVRKNNVFSIIDLFGRRKNKNTLRWAVMPYLMSISRL
ncbi:hypothetical protein [uncultured Fluviicola sp.]|uniref:hypothetical protein n=1 Tax=uncultured Fluviicola sp. TaxID=463303 RepID=UPI0025DE88EC|nr:hypothetical protein [uncultured Fluviicola sp.]